MKFAKQHERLCKVLGIEVSSPRPDWLPYAVQLTRIEVYVSGSRRMVYGGAMVCGRCEFGVSMKPGPGSSHPEPEALVACPKCHYRGVETQPALVSQRAVPSPLTGPTLENAND